MWRSRAGKTRILRHGRSRMSMSTVGVRMSTIIIHMPIVMCIVVIISSSPHFWWGNGTLRARHRFQHPFQSVAVQTHSIFPVHVFGALGFTASVGDVVVYDVVVMRCSQFCFSDHVYFRIIHGLGVGEHVVEIIPQRKPRRSRRRLRGGLERSSGLSALGFWGFGLGLWLRFALEQAKVVLGVE